MSHPIEEDLHVEAALSWLFEVCDFPAQLAERIESARAHYRDATDFKDGLWVTRDPFEGYADRMAVNLAQAVAMLRDRRTYDLPTASKTIPFIKNIGANIDLLRRIPGASERARRMLRPADEHPDSGVFELTAALRYAIEPGVFVEFIPEHGARSADFLLRGDNLLDEVHVECKRLKPSDYERSEKIRADEILNRINEFVHGRKVSLSVDVTFKKELSDIPLDYLLERLRGIKSSDILLPGAYPWSDEYGEGEARIADLGAVRRDIADSFLLVGGKLARLLAGGERPEEHFHLVCGGTPHSDDPRFIDMIDYGTAVFWRCIAEQSIEARARHITSKLADIDRQVANAPCAIAHIGMDVERDNATADLRRDRNLAAARRFRPKSVLLEIDLHYFMPRVTETASWMIDETVEPLSQLSEPFLSDSPRLLGGVADGLVEHEPAWRQPIPL